MKVTVQEQGYALVWSGQWDVSENRMMDQPSTCGGCMKRSQG